VLALNIHLPVTGYRHPCQYDGASLNILLIRKTNAEGDIQKCPELLRIFVVFLMIAAKDGAL